MWGIPPVVTEMARRCSAAGGRTLLVGGGVRDALRGEAVTDWDVEVFGLPEDRLVAVLKTFGRVNAVGKSFGVYKLGGLHEIDVSIPRRDSKRGPGHKGIHVEGDPHMSPTEAARRRDLTINAIMVDPLTGEFLDPWDGRTDLQRGLLRAVDPTTFLEDPLRALRVAQFAARLGFAIDDGLIALGRQAALDELPPERILGEWAKLLLKGRFIAIGMRYARDAAILSRVFPDLPDDRSADQALDHAIAARDTLEPEGRRLALMLTVWLWQAEVGGAQRTLDRLGVFRHKGFPTRDRALAVLTHRDRPIADDAALRRLSTLAEPELLLLASEVRGRSIGDALVRVAALGILHDAPPPLLQGRDLRGLPLPPGPEMGRLLKRVYDAQLDGAVSDAAEALALAQRWITSD